MQRENEKDVNNNVILNLFQDLNRFVKRNKVEMLKRVQHDDTCLTSGLHPTYNGLGPGYARAASTGEPLRSGFTLIELLVVVLIIGILVAVALPQYQKAVLKSRYVQLMAVTKTMAASAYRYYLANGTAPNYWAEMDVELPAGCTTTENEVGSILSCVKLKMQCDLGWGGLEDIMCVNHTDPAKTSLGYGEYFTPDKLNKRYCIARTTDANANAVCAGLGGKNPQTYNASVHFGSGGQVNFYTLP